MNKSTSVPCTTRIAVVLGLLAALPAVAQYSARQEIFFRWHKTRAHPGDWPHGPRKGIPLKPPSV